jgi:threonine/homoserine/homoserine lactone efflux protein
MAAGTLGRKLTVRTLSVINKIAGTILVGFGIALIWDVIVFHQLPK